VLDTYSRKILAWTVMERFDPSNTCQLLPAAGKHLVTAGRPLLYADSHGDAIANKKFIMSSHTAGLRAGEVSQNFRTGLATACAETPGRPQGRPADGG
jgi:hypothetical protein